MSGAPTSPLRWFGPVPARRLAIVRSLTFGYALAWLVVRAMYVADVARLPTRRYEPVGLLRLTSAPPPDAIVAALWVVTAVACGLSAWGRAVRLSAPLGAAGMLVLATYTSSFGQVFHTEHLLVLHLAILAVGALAEPTAPPDGETSGWPLNLMMAALAVVYVAAGVAKLRWSGVDWVTGDVLRNWIGVDNLRKDLVGDLYSPIGGWLSTIGWVWAPIALVTLLIELGAPLALIPGRIRTVWLLAAWCFHVGIFVLMAISFPYQLLGVAYAAFLPVERIADRAGAAWAERRRNTVTPLREDVTA